MAAVVVINFNVIFWQEIVSLQQCVPIATEIFYYNGTEYQLFIPHIYAAHVGVLCVFLFYGDTDLMTIPQG